MLPPYVNSLTTRWHNAGNSTSSFSIQPYCIAAFLATAGFFICWYLNYILTSINYFCWIVLVCIYRHAFRHILGFCYPPCLYLGEQHISWSTCSHKWHVFAILFLFMSCPEPPMGISGVGSFPVWSGGSVIIFQFFTCRNLALNRVFPTVLRGRHVLHLGGCLDTPCLCTPYIYMPLRGVQNPCVPHTCVHLYVLRGFCILWGVVRGALHVGHLLYSSPCMGVSPLRFPPPTHLLASLCISMFGDICMSCGDFSFMLGVLGVFPHLWGFWAHQNMGCTYAYSCTFL